MSVFNPKKSIFNNPALSTTLLSNWVTSKSESFEIVTGINSVISLGVIITPQACVPVFLTEPSITSACFNIFPSSVFLFFISSNSFTSLNAFFKLVPGVSGTNFAKRSVSESGKSNTRPASRMLDLAAIVPYVIIWATCFLPYLLMT